MLENMDWGFVLTAGGFVLGLVSIGLAIYYGVSRVNKNIKKNKNETKDSHNVTVGNNSSVTVTQTNSHNTSLSNNKTKDGE